MVRIDERVARCFGLLRTPEFEPLVKYLRDCREESLEAMAEITDPVQIHRLQGTVGTLKGLLEDIEQAENLIRKLKR